MPIQPPSESVPTGGYRVFAQRTYSTGISVGYPQEITVSVDASFGGFGDVSEAQWDALAQIILDDMIAAGFTTAFASKEYSPASAEITPTP